MFFVVTIISCHKLVGHTSLNHSIKYSTAIAVQYYAVSFNVGGLPGDLYMNTFYLALMEILGQVHTTFV